MDNLTRFDELLHEICVKWGYCGCSKNDTTINVSLLIPSNGPITSELFTTLVLIADDVNPYISTEKSIETRNGIERAFVKYMGGETVDAKEFTRSQ